jgi:hypothetical protein
MKFCKVSLFFVLLVAVCLPAMGQTAMRVNVPFNFIAAGTSLPAGHYRVLRVTKSTHGWGLTNDHAGAIVFTRPVDSTQKAHRASLVFLRAGGTYSLIQIWNGDSGLDVPQSKAKQTLVSKDQSKSNKYVEIGAE